ncbi:MAG TPA: SagB/ThcOx family dehydrogenase [Desulfonatronum sp.]|nr:SagB/ThcOx family dehydrogenase [Desulfonatronum sp.]
MIDDRLRAHRLFLTDVLRKHTDFSATDQNRNIPAPPVQKACDPQARRVRLANRAQWSAGIAGVDLAEAIARRKSRRGFSADPLSLEEFSFLLWATQGVRGVPGRGTVLRHVPSAGARHSFETYLFVRRVAHVPPGLYRFLPLDNELAHVRDVPDMEKALVKAALGQRFVGSGAVTFVWACVPYRMEWRYGLTAHRVILMDAGHVCQNLYLACEAVGAGTCAVGAYDQQEMDRLIGLDGEEEFTIYIAPVGKKSRED